MVDFLFVCNYKNIPLQSASLEMKVTYHHNCSYHKRADFCSRHTHTIHNSCLLPRLQRLEITARKPILHPFNCLSPLGILLLIVFYKLENIQKAVFIFSVRLKSNSIQVSKPIQAKTKSNWIMPQDKELAIIQSPEYKVSLLYLTPVLVCESVLFAAKK